MCMYVLMHVLDWGLEDDLDVIPQVLSILFLNTESLTVLEFTK